MTYQPPYNGKRINIKADSNSAIDNGTVTLASGSNVTLSQAGSTITIANSLTSQGGDVMGVGTILMYGGTSAPAGWALCNGAALNRSTYSDLFSAIGTTYGAGDGSTTFNIPDMRARAPVGAGTGTVTLTFSSRSTNTITVTGVSNTADNEIQTGTAVTYASTGTNIGGLSAGTYYLIRASNTSFTLASSRANAVAGTVVTLSSDGTGTRTFTITVGTKTMGNTGGEEAHSLLSAEMPSHNHTGPSHTHTFTGSADSQGSHNHGTFANGNSQNVTSTSSGSTFGVRTDGAGNAGNISNFTNSSGAHTHTVTGTTDAGGTGNTGSAGTSGNHNILQPFVVVNYIIKTTSTVTGNGNISAEYLRAQQLTDQTTNVSANDHIKFDTNQASSGGSISLDISTTYTTSAAAASIGRFQLAANKTYLLRGTLPSVDFSVSGGSLTYQWYDATNSAALGSSAVVTSADATLNGTGGYAEAVVTPSSNVLVELRIIAATNVSRIGVNGNNNGQASALIQLLVGASTSGTGGGVASFAISTKTADYTFTSGDSMVLVNATGGNITITLPAASTFANYQFYVKRIDSSGNTVTIARTGSDTIDGATSASIANQWTAMGFASDGTGWYVL